MCALDFGTQLEYPRANETVKYADGLPTIPGRLLDLLNQATPLVGLGWSVATTSHPVQQSDQVFAGEKPSSMESAEPPHRCL